MRAIKIWIVCESKLAYEPIKLNDLVKMHLICPSYNGKLDGVNPVDNKPSTK